MLLYPIKAAASHAKQGAESIARIHRLVDQVPTYHPDIVNDWESAQDGFEDLQLAADDIQREINHLRKLADSLEEKALPRVLSAKYDYMLKARELGSPVKEIS